MFDGNCFIRRAAILPDGRCQIDIKAENGVFDWHWAVSANGRGREVLAISLTAIATNRQVFCSVPDPTANILELNNYFGIVA